MKINKFLTFLFLFSLSFFGGLKNSEAGNPIELKINDLRGIDPRIDEHLKEAGYACDPSQLTLQIEDDSVLVTEDLLLPVVCRARPRDLISVGVTLSSIYFAGGNLTWAHASRKKNKILFHVDLGISGTPKNYNVGFSFDPHIGKKGFFIGASAQLLYVTNPLIENSQMVRIPAGGVELGWMKSWGYHDRIQTSVKIGISGTQYGYDNYFWPEGKVGVGVLLFNTKAKPRR